MAKALTLTFTLHRPDGFVCYRSQFVNLHLLDTTSANGILDVCQRCHGYGGYKYGAAGRITGVEGEQLVTMIMNIIRNQSEEFPSILDDLGALQDDFNGHGDYRVEFEYAINGSF